MALSNSTIQVFGYRSLIFKLVTTLIACAMGFYFMGFMGLAIVLICSVFVNQDAIDMMRVTLNDELLHVTRYIKLTDFDCKFWLKDIEAAAVYLRVKHGKASHADGSIHSAVDSYDLLHIVLKDGSEHEIMLLGIKNFERNMLSAALFRAGISDIHPSFMASR